MPRFSSYSRFFKAHCICILIILTVHMLTTSILSLISFDHASSIVIFLMNSSSTRNPSVRFLLQTGIHASFLNKMILHAGGCHSLSC